MKKIIVDNEVKLISDEISSKAISEAEFFPIDKKFLGKYLDKISDLDPVEFIFYNFEKVNSTYTNTLFLCLPEVWRKLEVDDLVSIMNGFNKTFSYYSLIQFSYKYIEINILPLIISKARERDENYYQDIKGYLLNQWNVLIKSHEEKAELENGYEKEYLDYDAEEWMYIRQKFLMDPRVSQANQSLEYLNDYVKQLF